MDSPEPHERDAKEWLEAALDSRFDLKPAECIDAAKVHALLALAAAIGTRTPD